jgi:hypothetical protein
MHEQQCQHRPLPQPTQRERLAVARDLERPEEPEVQRAWQGLTLSAGPGCG